MGTHDLSNYLDRHCRFRFRGGKEAFGVIWKIGDSLVFSSKEFYARLNDDRQAVNSSDLLQIDGEDVMLAEPIL